MPTIVIGASISRTGAYRSFGRQIEAALRMFEADANAGLAGQVIGRPCAVKLELYDDQSRSGRTREIYRSLCAERRADLLLGPYSTGLTRAAARVAEEYGRVMMNHGGAGNDLHDGRTRMLVGVLTPASEYLTGFVRLLTTLKLRRKRVALVVAPTPFALAAAAGAERALSERRSWILGVRIRVKFHGRFDPTATPAPLDPALRRNRVNVMLSAGGYEHDVAAMRYAIESRLNLPVLGCIAAGVTRFGADLGGEADGIVGPSQWEEDLAVTPEIGPAPREFGRRMRERLDGAPCDYPAAQAYAAGLIALAALRDAPFEGAIDQAELRAALARLQATTMYGEFGVDPTSGRQTAHRMLLVQWHRGRKMIIDPAALDERGDLEFPSGWRLIVSSLNFLRMRTSAPEEPSAAAAESDKSEDDKDH